MYSGSSAEAAEKPIKEYQAYAVNWLLDRLYVKSQKGAGCFLDPGLGKTRITLTALYHLFAFAEIERALVVAPLRPVYSVWGQEIKKWGFPFSYSILHKQTEKALRYNCQIELVNYEGLAKLITRDVRGKRMPRLDLTDRWDIIILDESTWVKTWGATRAKNLRALLPTIPRRIILTGTPAANSLLDLYPQIYTLDDGAALGKNVSQFRKEYGMMGGYPFPRWGIRPQKAKQLHAAIAPMVLRMQAEDYLDMPRLVVNDVWCKLAPGELRQYAKLREELAVELESCTVTVGSAAGAYIKCVQFANGGVYNTNEAGEKSSHVVHSHKTNAVRELYDELGGKPALLFYSFGHDLERLKACPEFKNAPVINGDTKPKEADGYIEKWNRGEYPAMFCQWQAASHGLNLQYACNDVICVGVPDRSEAYDQAFRRVYRQGVTGDQVRIHRIFTEDTVDELMLERLNGKFATQKEFLDALKKHARGTIKSLVA